MGWWQALAYWPTRTSNTRGVRPLFRTLFWRRRSVFSSATTQGNLADINHDLISTYRAVRDEWQAVEQKLSVHAAKHSREHYYSVREEAAATPVENAAKFIYLNKTCWNGLYRVNKRGEFNVPIGTKSKVLLEGELRAAAEALAGAVLHCADFEKTLAQAREGDFAYVDPPYTVKHNKNGFLKYNQTLFSWDDQIRLRDAVVAACRRGVKILVFNAAHDSLIELYSDVGKIIALERASVISGKSSGRKREQEILVKCF